MKKSWQRGLYCLVLLAFITASKAKAMDQIGRLGVGMTQALKTDLPALSFKLQKSPSFAMGGLVGISTDDNSGGYAAGIKLYRNFFDEPQLNFYGSFMGALVKRQTSASTSQSGFQFDLTLGTEFSFVNLQSLGFSFEFGLSLNKLDDFVVETVGYHFIVAAVHFYL